MLLKQIIFFESLVSKFGPHKVLVKTIAELLSIDPRTAARKISSDIILTTDEVVAIASYFNISLDEHLGLRNKHYSFEFAALANNTLTLHNFLSPIHDDLNSLVSVPNVEIWYASQELPFFYYLKYPKLANFKLYSLLLANRRETTPEFQSLENFTKTITPEYIAIMNNIHSLYTANIRYEIWNINVISNTINQIRYYFLSGQLGDKAAVIQLLTEFKQMIQDIHVMATDHSSQATMHLYHNEIIHTNNAITVKNPYQAVVYVTFNNPNYFKITDPQFVKYACDWLDVLIHKATPLTNGSEKDIKSFFKHLTDSIDRAVIKVEAE